MFNLVLFTIHNDCEFNELNIYLNYKKVLTILILYIYHVVKVHIFFVEIFLKCELILILIPYIKY